MLDPAVTELEALLTAAAARRPAPPLASGGPRLSVTHALAVCACITLDDAPTWLLYVTADGGGFGWTRVPDGDESLDLVDAGFAAVEHAAPSDVLAWLQESSSGSFGDGGPELRAVLEALAQVTAAGR